jgi:hypothetical protein
MDSKTHKPLIDMELAQGEQSSHIPARNYRFFRCFRDDGCPRGSSGLVLNECTVTVCSRGARLTGTCSTHQRVSGKAASRAAGMVLLQVSHIRVIRFALSIPGLAEALGPLSSLVATHYSMSQALPTAMDADVPVVATCSQHFTTGCQRQRQSA